MTHTDLTPSNEPATNSVASLVAEVERMRKYIVDYNAAISAKMNAIEEDVERMEAENQRLVGLKQSLSIERDACVGLLMKLALANGMKVGVAPGNVVVADLPGGQVSWTYEESEAHLFEDLPNYSGPVETLTLEENYARVMNPQIGDF